MRVALAIVVLVGALLRVALLDLDARYDEAFSFFAFATRPLGEGLADYAVPNNHLLNTALMHGAWRAFGTELWVVRLPAVLAGVALVPAVFAAGRALYDRETGIVAAALVAGSAPMIEFSVNGRGYTLSWLALAVLLVLTARLLDAPDARAWALWATAAALSLLAVPTAALALAVVAVWFAVSVLAARTPRRLAELAGALAATGLATLALYAPTLGDPGWSFDDRWPGSAASFARTVWDAAHAGWGPVVQVVVALAALAGVLLHRRVAGHLVPLPAVAAVVVPALALLLPRVPPYTRAWLFLVPLWLLTAAAGAVALARRRGHTRFAIPAAAIALAAVLALTFDREDLPYEQDAPVLGAGDAADRLALARPATQVAVTPFSLPALCLADAIDGGGALPLTTAPVRGRAVLVISRTRGETPALAARFLGADPARLGQQPIATFDEVDLLAADLPATAPPIRQTCASLRLGRR